MRVRFHSSSPAQTQQIAARLGSALKGGDVVALEGELGAGKTVFVRGLAQGLGIKPAVVSSPTFVIRQDYEAASDSALELVHIDAYRLSGPEELATIGWSELLEQRDVVIALEWPSRIASALPPLRIDVVMIHSGEKTRLIQIDLPAELSDRLRDLESSGWKIGVDIAKCRKCGVEFNRGAPTFPFCSARCKLADLGKWFSEGYRVSRPVESDDELSE